MGGYCPCCTYLYLAISIANSAVRLPDRRVRSSTGLTPVRTRRGGNPGFAAESLKPRFPRRCAAEPGGAHTGGLRPHKACTPVGNKAQCCIAGENMPVAGRPSVLRQRAYTVTCHLVTRSLGDAQPTRLGPPPPTSTPFETTLDRPDTTGSLYTVRRGGSELSVTPCGEPHSWLVQQPPTGPTDLCRVWVPSRPLTRLSVMPALFHSLCGPRVCMHM